MAEPDAMRIGTGVHHRTASSYMRTPVPAPGQPHELSLACWCGPLATRIVCRHTDDHEHEGWDRPHFMPNGSVLHLL